MVRTSGSEGRGDWAPGLWALCVSVYGGCGSKRNTEGSFLFSLRHIFEDGSMEVCSD